MSGRKPHQCAEKETLSDHQVVNENLLGCDRPSWLYVMYFTMEKAGPTSSEENNAPYACVRPNKYWDRYKSNETVPNFKSRLV